MTGLALSQIDVQVLGRQGVVDAEHKRDEIGRQVQDDRRAFLSFFRCFSLLAVQPFAAVPPRLPRPPLSRTDTQTSKATNPI